MWCAPLLLCLLLQVGDEPEGGSQHGLKGILEHSVFLILAACFLQYSGLIPAVKPSTSVHSCGVVHTAAMQAVPQPTCIIPSCATGAAAEMTHQGVPQQQHLCMLG
jgi:hypothetical protein